MRGKVATIKLSQIVRKPELFPRDYVNWVIAQRYYQALQSGAKFPPIVVAKSDGKFILVDGWHRFDAFKRAKRRTIEVEVLTGLTPEQIYIESVKRNAGHGKQFSVSEMTKVILRLKDFKLPNAEISKIIHIPTDKIRPFLAKRVIHTATGREILKKPLYHLSEKSSPLSKRALNDLDSMSGSSQIMLLNDVIALLKNPTWLNYRDKKVRTRLNELYKLMKKTMRKIKRR